MSAQLTESERQYTAELAAEIVRNGNPDGDLLTEILAAHGRRQQFISEMAEGRTGRARMAHAALSASLYADIICANAGRLVDSQCAYIDSRGAAA